MFTINYDKARQEAVLNREYGQRILIEEGTYEAKIISAEKRQANSGTGLISVKYEIRKDFAQAHQGATVEEAIFANKGTVNFDTERLIDNAIEVNIPSGTQVSSTDEYCRLLIGREVKLKVEIEERPGRDGNMFKNNVVKKKAPSEISNTNATTLDDDELPF